MISSIPLPAAAPFAGGWFISFEASVGDGSSWEALASKEGGLEMYYFIINMNG